MANIDDILPSGRFLKAADVPEPVKVRISHVTVEQIGRDQKTVAIIHFGGKLKPLVGNTTNLRTIADAYGKDYELWPGAEIVLFSTPVDYQGRTVDGLRVRIPKQTPARATPNARSRQEAPPEPTPPVEAYELDDEILDDDF